MSQPRLFARQAFQFLKTTPLLTHVRTKVTSEHVLKLRGGSSPKKASEPFRTQVQIQMDTKSHMAFMPVPEGSWGEYHKARNLKWSQMVMVSFTALCLTIFCMDKADCFFMHDLPPLRHIRPDNEKTGKIQG